MDNVTDKPIINLSDNDGNAYVIIGRCRRVLRNHLLDNGLTHEEADELVGAFTAEAKAGDYDHVLQTVMKWFEVE